MTITIELDPDIEQKLEQQARQRRQSLPEYVKVLIVEGASERSLELLEEWDAFARNPRISAGIEDAKLRIQALMESDPEFATALKHPKTDVPRVDEDVLNEAERCRAGDHVFEDLYGKELADIVGASLRE